ncbi:MAG TPA: hypothetical protein VFD53_00365, partial [Ilumatobacter sp.]|nr:hypothetical protein [Ilumatobacter sp.]
LETLTKLDRLNAAAVLLGALEVSTTAPPLIGTDAQRISQVRAALRRRLGTRNFDEAVAHGATLGDEQALAAARQHATHRDDRRPAG